MSIVLGDGPVPSDIMLLGEAPGFEEQIEGRGFVGKSGAELWSGFKRHAKLERKSVYVSNLVKEGLPNNRDPKYHEIVKWIPDLLEELERVKPKLIITAGGFSSRFFLDRKMADVHGILHETTFLGKPLKVFPIYHPAAGLHNKAYLSAFGYDCTQLGKALGPNGNLLVWEHLKWPVTVQWLKSPAQVTMLDVSHVGIDTEGWKHKPWGLSFTTNGHEAFIIRADQKELLRWFAKWILTHKPVGHNLLHDIPVFRSMGVTLPDMFDDTMVLGYHHMLRTGSGVLESEAQNLGTQAYRELGMVLQELSDLDGVDFSTETIPYTEQVKDYAGMDCIAAWHLRRVHNVLAAEPIYQIDRDAILYVEQMIAEGLPFDIDHISDLYGDVLARSERLYHELRSMAERRGVRDFNPGSHPQVRELVTKKYQLRVRKRTKGGKASTNEKALAQFKDHPFVKAIGDYRESEKLRGTYIEPLLKELLNAS